MAAAALRFLAHCFKMTLPVSLSASAGESECEREDLYLPSFTLLPSVTHSLLCPPLQGFLLLSIALPPRVHSLGASSSHVTATLEPAGWGMGRQRGGGICAGCHSDPVDGMRRATWLPQQQTPPLLFTCTVTDSVRCAYCEERIHNLMLTSSVRGCFVRRPVHNGSRENTRSGGYFHRYRLHWLPSRCALCDFLMFNYTFSRNVQQNMVERLPRL